MEEPTAERVALALEAIYAELCEIRQSLGALTWTLQQPKTPCQEPLGGVSGRS